MKNSYCRLFFGLIAMSLWLSLPLNAKILLRPYLQAATQNSICVVFETDSKRPPFVVYHAENSPADTAFNFTKEDAGSKLDETFICKIELRGLKPNTKYYYYAEHSGDRSAESEFRTLPESGPIRFAVYGDFRSGGTNHNRVAAAVLKELPMFSLLTGDLCYSGTYNSWRDDFFVENESKLISRVPFFNAVGNHEYQTNLVKVYTQAPKCPSGDNLFYSFDCGDAHFLIINSEGKLTKKSAQYKFIENDLGSTTKKWKIVVFHSHAYCAGGHGEVKKMKRITTELLEKYGVDVVFNGHTHLYQHNFVNGIHHVVSAGGGAPLYEPGRADYVLKTVKEHHYCIVEIDGGRFVLTARTPDGVEIDRFELKK